MIPCAQITPKLGVSHPQTQAGKLGVSHPQTPVGYLGQYESMGGVSC